MIAVTGACCDASHLGAYFDRADQERLMAIQPTGPRPAAAAAAHWYASSSTCNRSYLLAGMRAVVIALLLLGVLALIVLF
jgi:hypothetical protein